MKILKQLPPTYPLVQSEIKDHIEVNYIIKVLHKLDAWNKVGEGKAILIPIKVF